VEADEINYQEGLFGWPKTKFNHVGQMVNSLDPFLKLWTIVSNFSTSYTKWMGGPFSGLDPEKIETDVGDMYRNIYKLTKLFSGAGSGPELPEPLKVAENTRLKIDKFKVYLPLIQAVCNVGLRDRHWAQMSEVRSPLAKFSSIVLIAWTCKSKKLGNYKRHHQNGSAY
jgi:dynein heavy chain